MPKLKAGTILVTAEEELKIQAGIDADPDAYSLTDEEWKKVKLNLFPIFLKSSLFFK